MDLSGTCVWSPGFDNGSGSDPLCRVKSPVPMAGRHLWTMLLVSTGRCHRGQLLGCLHVFLPLSMWKEFAFSAVHPFLPLISRLMPGIPLVDTQYSTYSAVYPISRHGKWIRSTTFNSATGVSRDQISRAENGCDRNSSVNQSEPTPAPDFDTFFDCFVLLFLTFHSTRYDYPVRHTVSMLCTMHSRWLTVCFGCRGPCMLFLFLFFTVG